MKEISSTQLKTNLGDFFDALLRDGGVIITRHGKRYPVGLLSDTDLHDARARLAKEHSAKLDRFLAAQGSMQEALSGESPASLGLKADEMTTLEGE